MNEYTVLWQIQVSADTPYEAAKIARSMQVDPDTTATVFEVIQDEPKLQTTPIHVIDLEINYEY